MKNLNLLILVVLVAFLAASVNGQTYDFYVNDSLVQSGPDSSYTSISDHDTITSIMTGKCNDGYFIGIPAPRGVLIKEKNNWSKPLDIQISCTEPYTNSQLCIAVSDTNPVIYMDEDENYTVSGYHLYLPIVNSV